jgi:hypothetical protein
MNLLFSHDNSIDVLMEYCITIDPTPSYRPLREYSTLHSWKGLASGLLLLKQSD